MCMICAAIPAAFADGDTFSVQMRANGKFVVYQNGKLLARRKLAVIAPALAQDTGTFQLASYRPTTSDLAGLDLPPLLPLPNLPLQQTTSLTIDYTYDALHRLTGATYSDDEAVGDLLAQIEAQIIKFAADGAYDKRKVYDAVNEHSPNADILIPPRKNARIWKHGNTKSERFKRDENLRSIRKHGRKEWKKQSGYHARSLSETAMFRLKTIFGGDLSARLLETQKTQALVRCAALNRTTHLGMPQSYKAA